MVNPIAIKVTTGNYSGGNISIPWKDPYTLRYKNAELLPARKINKLRILVF